MENCLPIPIPLGATTNVKEVAAYETLKAEQQASGGKLPLEVVRPIIPAMACFEAFAEREEIDRFYSTGAEKVCTGSK
jgi:hypothetical protein